ncbi:MAG: chemotaxis protein CheW [Betaproteobacteria bacterium]|nr:chemotaxis protein CheW [Betaproteobacteria bacterium]
MKSAVLHAKPGAESAQPGVSQYLTFVLGGETYAVGILRIKEIIEYGALTSVPMMPSFIRGVINLRGAVVPVVDLQARFGKTSTQVARRTCIVILEIESNGESQDIGVLVDAVNAVLDIAEADIEPPPSFGTGIRPDFVEGMGKIDGRFVIILDLSRVLSIDELARLASASQQECESAF